MFSPEMKMSDLVNLDYRLLTVISRMGIKVGFGERSVAEVCSMNGVDTATFILVCTMYSLPEFVPDKNSIAAVRPGIIVDYLHNSHSSYIKYGFMEIEKAMKELVEPCDAKQKKIILSFLAGYRKEVENHFDYEEQTLFPYVRAMLDGTADGSYTIAEFREQHSNIEEKLEDLKNIVLKYLPEDCDSELAGRILMQLFSLAEDLDIHTAIEIPVLDEQQSVYHALVVPVIPGDHVPAPAAYFFGPHTVYGHDPHAHMLPVPFRCMTDKHCIAKYSVNDVRDILLSRNIDPRIRCPDPYVRIMHESGCNGTVHDIVKI